MLTFEEIVKSPYKSGTTFVGKIIKITEDVTGELRYTLQWGSDPKKSVVISEKDLGVLQTLDSSRYEAYQDYIRMENLEKESDKEDEIWHVDVELLGHEAPYEYSNVISVTCDDGFLIIVQKDGCKSHYKLENVRFWREWKEM